MRLIPLLFTLGTLAMSTAVADDKKRDPQKAESYDEVVTVRQWYGGKFLNPVKDQPAYRGENGGKMVFYTKPQADNAKTPKGSEITDKDGTVYVVEKAIEGSDFWINYVKPKPKGK